MSEFSFKTRAAALERFRSEKFDLLIIGGGITGAGTARDAASRGLKVALVEARDFAWGTSSRSSKLIHGGLRYLQNMELGLVFEALSERTHLLKTMPHMVRPLPFFLPVYRGEKPGKALLSIGLWLYDILALGRSPGVHRKVSKDDFLKQIPFLKGDGLLGGFRYFDASMWDDVLTVETLRDASRRGAAIANYTEAITPLRDGERVVGFQVKDLVGAGGGETIDLKASRVVVCAGPWTDQVGKTLSADWHRWLNPSKGVHLLFDLKKMPLPGAVVMAHPDDGRISFVIPRPDLGAGVVIVGTTDGPTPDEPEKAIIEPADVRYLMDLLNRYFPSLRLTTDDIISAYIGVRPLMGSPSTNASAEDLQKVSREHYIGLGPGGVVLVAGGKYTTYRPMAREIVDFALKEWKQAADKGGANSLPYKIGSSRTKEPVNPDATAEAIRKSRSEAGRRGWTIPETIWERYGGEALRIMELHESIPDPITDVEGFPYLGAQLRYEIRTGMVVRLEDFYFRRIPLFAARRDHGLPWAESLARIWAEERGLDTAAAISEVQGLREECAQRDQWRSDLSIRK